MKIKKWFWGLFFILSGGLFLVNASDMFSTSIHIWNLLLTIFLMAIVVGSIIHFSWFGILVPISIMGVIFAQELGITAITPWPLIITAVLFSIGLETIFSSKNKFIKLGIFHDHNDFDEVIDEEDNEEVKYSVSFGSGVKYVNSKNFKKGYFSCRFGALSVYFDNAIPNKDGAEIYLDVSFGGVELYIPKEWHVESTASVMLGGIDETRKRHADPGAPKVTIKGNVSLAGIDIIYI